LTKFPNIALLGKNFHAIKVLELGKKGEGDGGVGGSNQKRKKRGSDVWFGECP